MTDFPEAEDQIEQEDERLWQAKFTASSDKLRQMADAAQRERRAGKTLAFQGAEDKDHPVTVCIMGTKAQQEGLKGQ